MAATDGATAGGTRTAPALDHAAYARVVFQLADATAPSVQPATSWTITLNAGRPPQLDFIYVAGHHGESTTPDPLDVQITDDDAPACSSPSRAARRTSPSRRASSCSARLRAPPCTDCTHFHGRLRHLGAERDRGPQHAAEPRPTSSSASGAATRTPTSPALPSNVDARAAPHRPRARATARATSTSSPSPTADAGGARSGVVRHRPRLRVRRPDLWLSLLRLYNATGDLLAQGPGFSNPLRGGARRQLDVARRLPRVHVRDAAGDYYLEVGELAVLDAACRPASTTTSRSRSHEPPDRRLRVRAVAGARGRERQQHDAAGARPATTSSTFFDPLVGDTWRTGGDDRLDDAVRPDPGLRRRLVRPLLVRRHARAMLNPPALTSRRRAERQRRRPERPVLHERQPPPERPRHAGRRVDARPPLPRLHLHRRPRRHARFGRTASRRAAARALHRRLDDDTGCADDPRRERLQPHRSHGERDQARRKRRRDRDADPVGEDDERRPTSPSRPRP